MSNSNIHYLQRKDIDENAWNHCIEKAENGLIYAYTFYLDAMCTAWDGIVLNDYEAIMPLPWRKKYGIPYLYAPAFIQQLGFIGNWPVSLCVEVSKIIDKRFKFGDLFFNFQNQVQYLTFIQSRTNFVIDLNRTYETIAEGFSNDLKRNLKVAKRNFLLLEDKSPAELVIRFFQKHYQARMPNITDGDYDNFSRLCLKLETKDMAITRMLVDPNNEIMTASLFLKDKKRIYNLMGVTPAQGRKVSAKHLLYTEVLKEFSERPLLFDIEGSDMKGVKDFYSNFNPVNQPYFYYHFNNLPFPLRLFKR